MTRNSSRDSREYGSMRRQSSSPPMESAWSPPIGTSMIHPTEACTFGIRGTACGPAVAAPGNLKPPNPKKWRRMMSSATEGWPSVLDALPRKQNRLQADSRCLEPFRSCKSPGYVVALYMSPIHAYRVVPLDGRLHIGENIRLWGGFTRSVGGQHPGGGRDESGTARTPPSYQCHNTGEDAGFYEQAGATHDVWKNASQTQPARLLAMIFAKGSTLTTPVQGRGGV
jgi:hypothetical protein